MKQAKQVLLFAEMELECICDAQNNMLLWGSALCKTEKHLEATRSVEAQFVPRARSYASDVTVVT